MLFPFTRLLGRHGLVVKTSWGFPLDGSSPTSRPAMRWAAWLLRPLLRSPVANGDTLCLLIVRSDAVVVDKPPDLDKAMVLTAHYS